MTAVLELRGFAAGWHGIEVVRDLDLRVEAGEVVALLGPNGAGKTTTLLTISGVLDRLGGECLVAGSAQPRRASTRRALKLARAGVGHVPEDRAIFPQLTAREHLRLASRGDRAAFDAAVAPFPLLEPIMDRRVGLMSGGEQQMVAVARALATRPKLLMLDELSLGLAPIIVEQLLPLVRTIASDTGAGVLLVEQHVGAALAVADRAAVLVHGELVFEGDAAAIGADVNALADVYLGG